MDGYRKMNAAIAKVEKEELERDEVDRMSFGQRLKSVMAKSKRASSSGGFAKGSGQVARSLVDTVVKKEDEGSDSQDNPSNFSSILMDDKIYQSAGKRNPVHVKVEPVDNNMIETTVKNEMGNLSNSSMVRVKSGGGIIYEFTEDELDNMLLSERMKLYSEEMAPSFKIGRVVECSSETAPSISDCTPISAASAKPLKVCPPRKQRKTATDSVQAAMEEDAPGLLRVLIENGVTVDEMKLYGKNESNEPLDGLSFEDNFSELRAVISKLLSSQRQSLLKLASLQSTKGEKASYCLACLFSLIEQARYLQFRKWPVEWGWCRDLQSFIFVFERHNRIVLERPEYGYATYFFELVDSTPIDWQIRRLVIAMKLTSYSRVTLIENKKLTIGATPDKSRMIKIHWFSPAIRDLVSPEDVKVAANEVFLASGEGTVWLMLNPLVGKDLSEGEAKVLTSYGWIPNTGLGTMLKYCDRVIHDRISEKDGSEWKSKIEKLLVAGYSGGSIVENPMDHNVAQDFPEIKLELE